MENYRKILVRGLNRIGDALYTLPVFKCLKKGLPSSNITLLSKPNIIDLYRNNPYVDEIITFDYSKQHKGIKGRLKLIKDLKRRNFDLAILLHNCFDAAVVAFLAGIPERIGYKKEMRGPLLTKSLSFPEKPVHRLDYNLNLLRLINIVCEDKNPELFISEDEQNWAKEFIGAISSRKLRVAMVIGSKAETRRWPIERFAALTKRLKKTYDMDIFILGSGEDSFLAEKLMSLTDHIPVDLTGRFTLRQLIAFIGQLDLVIANDTGPMHIAAVLCVPTVTFFGAGDIIETAPVGPKVSIIKKDLPCAPCVREVCPEGTLECLKAITVDEVYEEAVRWLKTSS